jgi:lipopolysaccharide/colanic/teichoic acid biosynthesis glycosyltransferase
MTFRNNSQSLSDIDLNNSDLVMSKIDTLNKKINLNLIILNFKSQSGISKVLEEYLVNLNKKILIISKQPMKFNNNFLYREEVLSGSYLTYFNNDIQYGSKYILKRFLDITLGSLAIVLFSPIMVLLALYILFLDKGPTVIKQNRVGLHGEQFSMYKFRTMKNNAHDLREDLEDLNKNDEIIFKIKNDPRIIKGTNFMRNFSLDELPQLINVIKGDMSLVGPRPLFEEDTILFNKNYMRRLNVLPGITGLLQINERNTSNFETWYKYDIEYIENWSLYLDLKIIFKTPFALFNSKIKGI